MALGNMLPFVSINLFGLYKLITTNTYFNLFVVYVKNKLPKTTMPNKQIKNGDYF